MIRGKKILLVTLAAFFAGALLTAAATFLYIRPLSGMRLSSGFGQRSLESESAPMDDEVPELLLEGEESIENWQEPDVPENRKRFVQRYRSTVNRLFDSLLDDRHFTGSANPFEEMEKMHRQMMDELGHVEGLGQSAVPVEVVRREDDRFVYFDVIAEDYARDSLKVTVKDTTITIAGKIIRGGGKTRPRGKRDVAPTSRFSKSFPVPLGVDANGIEMSPVDGQILIKFPKTR